MKCLALLVENVQAIQQFQNFQSDLWICGLFRLASGTGFPLYFKISPEHVSGTMFNEGCKCLKSLPSIWNWFENHKQGAWIVWRETWWSRFLLLIWQPGTWAGYLGIVNLIMYLPVLSGTTLGVCNNTASDASERFQAEEVGSDWTEESPRLDSSLVVNFILI